MSTKCAPKLENTVEIKVERLLEVLPAEAFDAWINPETPGTPWSEHDQLLFTPRVDGFFYWQFNGSPHYGRFLQLDHPAQLQNTWVSRSTLGEETLVTVSFKSQGQSTLMTLIHSGLPNADAATAHEKGWNYFLDKLSKNQKFGKMGLSRG